MKKFLLTLLLIICFIIMGCFEETQEDRDAKNVNRQQLQYAKGQPVPAFNWSLERELMIQLYNLRNRKVATHAVWRSDYGIIEGDCPCMGYGLPYDVSLTNPLKPTGHSNYALTSIEQSEPNGIFASKNTTATWVMCTGVGGTIEPVYVESKVTVYPGPVKVDYEKNRVVRTGATTVKLGLKMNK
jgi:hypothetical protein